MLQRYGGRLSEYIRSHLHVMDDRDMPWLVEVRAMEMKDAEQTATGPYHEVVVHLWLVPPAGASTRRFILHYDAIIHQVVTHRAIVSVRQDWDNGMVDGRETELGVIVMDTDDNTVAPLRIDRDDGSVWRGFGSLVQLGMQHIAEGSDHLLFLLVLLLPAPLLARNRRWTVSGGTRYSIIKLLKIISAFTVGHSLTLLAGTVGWLRLPSQPVEIIIAVSILVTSIHAVRPIIAGNEIYVAGGFGLVHGLGFAGMLGGLNLEPSRLVLGILGFNLGIEIMQLFVVFLTVPWLILMSTRSSYRWVRLGGAAFAAIAAVAWIVERVAQEPNAVGTAVAEILAHGNWIVLGLAIAAIASTIWGSEIPGAATEREL